MNTARAATTSHRPTHDEIAAAACHLYLESGRCDGDFLQDWLRAEALLLEAINLPSSPSGDDTFWLPDGCAARSSV
jgi:hypothetical protein